MASPPAPTRARPWGYRIATRACPWLKVRSTLRANSYNFHGVILVRPKALERLVSQRAHKNPQMPYVKPGTNVCAFAFTGNFPAGQVAGSPGNDAGKAAIVLVTTDHKLLFSFVLGKLPEDFGRPFTGA